MVFRTWLELALGVCEAEGDASIERKKGRNAKSERELLMRWFCEYKNRPFIMIEIIRSSMHIACHIHVSPCYTRNWHTDISWSSTMQSIDNDSCSQFENRLFWTSTASSSFVQINSIAIKMAHPYCMRNVFFIVFSFL